MKKALFVSLFLLFLITLLISTGEKAHSFFVGFGSGGAVSNTIKDGQSKGLIPIDAPPPGNLSAALIGWTEIDLSWQNNTPGQTNIIIQRQLWGGSYTTIATAAPSATSYADNLVTANNTYIYRLRAITPAGLTKVSNEDTNMTAPPTAPTNLTGASAGASSVSLYWTVNSVNEAGFYIELAVGSGTFSSTVTVARKSAAYTWTGLLQNSPYTFRTRAFNVLGNSVYSNTTTVTTSLYTWNVATVCNTSSFTNPVALYKMAFGNGRNDATNRIYCGLNSPVYSVKEFTYAYGAGWAMTDATPVSINSTRITTWNSIVRAIAIGNTKNDGTPRLVYALGTSLTSNIGTSAVGEINYNLAGHTFIWTTPAVSTTRSGNLNHDVIVASPDATDAAGPTIINKVFSVDDLTKVYQSYYTTGVYGEVSINSTGMTNKNYSVLCDSLKTSDTKKRIYAAADNGKVYEYTWTSSATVTNFTETTIATNSISISPSTTLKTLTTGTCRNDGVKRLYYGGGDGHVYELTSTSPTAWTNTDSGSLTNAITAIVAGNVTPDGYVNIYAATTNRDIFQLSGLSGTSEYSIVRIGGTTGWVNDMQIFAGRNDGTSRLYLSTDDGYLLEYTAQ